MKKVTVLVAAVLSAVFLFSSNSQAADAKLGSTQVKAGTPITVSGSIEPGQELYVTVASEKMFAPKDAPGPKEKSRLTNGKDGKNAFGDTEIPASFYVVTSAPETLAAPKEVWKGQTQGVFAFPPFKYRVMVNKILPWEKIDPSLVPMLGPVSTEAQWKFVTFTHEKKFGINTVSKEPGKGGGNARMIMSDYNTTQELWNEGVAVELDKATGKFSVTMTPYKNLAPETKLAVYVNGDKVDTVTIEKSGFFFATGNVYMNPLVVFGGAFIIGMLFVIMGAAGGLFTAAFQITVVGTKGPIGINAGNTIKPTNLFLTMCSPITGLMTFVKEKRFAYPVAIPFAIGIVAGAFFIGPPLSAKYLNLAAFKFYLGYHLSGYRYQALHRVSAQRHCQEKSHAGHR